MGWYGEWRPYVPVAQRRAEAAGYAAKLAKNEKRELVPLKVEGRAIATSFWGKAWCDHLECFSDFANRLPRGRTYIRNGSVVDLQIQKGVVKAIVGGSDVYEVTVKIKTLAPAAWKVIKQDCARSIASLIDLLQGRFDAGVMQRLTERDRGLFPRPQEIEMDCSCPDWAGMCKHVAAVLYGVGNRLDAAPELLFTLRSVDHLDLTSQAADAGNLDQALTADSSSALAASDLGEMFGIDIDVAKPAGPVRKSQVRRRIDPPAKSPSVARPGRKSVAKPTAEATRVSKQKKSTVSRAKKPRAARPKSLTSAR